jgi:hypothetical protein
MRDAGNTIVNFIDSEAVKYIFPHIDKNKLPGHQIRGIEEDFEGGGGLERCHTIDVTELRTPDRSHVSKLPGGGMSLMKQRKQGE